SVVACCYAVRESFGTTERLQLRKVVCTSSGRRVSAKCSAAFRCVHLEALPSKRKGRGGPSSRQQRSWCCLTRSAAPRCAASPNSALPPTGVQLAIEPPNEAGGEPWLVGWLARTRLGMVGEGGSLCPNDLWAVHRQDGDFCVVNDGFG